MKLFKKITYPEHLKNYIIFFIIYFLMNNIAAIGSDHKSYLFKSKQKYDEFEKIYTDNSIHYSEYDNLGSQLKTFFGFMATLSESVFAIFLLFGLLTRISASLLLITMLVASAHHLVGQKFPEMAILYATFCILMLVAGPGKYSIDKYLTNRLEN